MHFRLGGSTRRRFEASSLFSFHPKSKSAKKKNKIFPTANIEKVLKAENVESHENEESLGQENRYSFKSANQSIIKLIHPDNDDCAKNKFEDGMTSKIEYQKFQIIEASIAIFTLLGVFLAILSV